MPEPVFAWDTKRYDEGRGRPVIVLLVEVGAETLWFEAPTKRQAKARFEDWQRARVEQQGEG